MTDNTQPEAGSTHLIRYALELGLLWIDGSGRNKVCEALDALDALEAKLTSIGAGGVQALSAAPKAAPQQDAQEPVAWLNPWRADQVTTDYDAYGEHGIPLYTAPQPAPAPLSDDTERLEWLLWKLPGDALRYVVGELSDTSSGAEFRAAIDAALAAQGGK